MHNYIIEFLCFLLPHFPPTSVCIFSLKSASKSLDEHLLTEKCYCEIAREENVDESAVRRSIERAIIRLKPLLSGTGISKSDFERPVPTRYIKHRREKKKKK